MDWNDFAKRLTLELARLPVTSFLIVQCPSGLPYVQAMRSESALDAEAVASVFLPRPLAPRQERRLAALGWEPPGERPNWWHRYPVRDRGGRASSEHLEACALLAGQMIGAFRDVYGIPSPLELVYQAGRSDGDPLALPGLGIPLAVPESEPAPQDRPRRAAAPSGSHLESALGEARERGDEQTYLELLVRAPLYLPSPGDATPDGQYATARFGDGTFILAFTSLEAMDRSLQGQAVHHRTASLAELSRHWPHPDWQLAVNPGLPSAAYLDAQTLLDPVPPDAQDVHVAGPSTTPTPLRPTTQAPPKGKQTSPKRDAPKPARDSVVRAAAGQAPALASAPVQDAPIPAAVKNTPDAGQAIPPAHRPDTTRSSAARDTDVVRGGREPGMSAPPHTPSDAAVQGSGAPARDAGSGRGVVAPRYAFQRGSGKGGDPSGTPPTSLGGTPASARDGGAGIREGIPEDGLGGGPGALVVVQKVVRKEHVKHYLEGGYDLVAGYVHRLDDVRALRTPAELTRGLGLVYEGSPFGPGDKEIFVIRWPAVRPDLFRRPLGGIDEWSMGIIPGGWVIEKAPFPGSGYAPGEGPAIPEFKIDSQRVPHGAELYRLDVAGAEALVAAYDADLRRWLVRLPGGRA